MKRKLYALPPMKNESWILERFLKCTSLWADHIILLDQNSEDNSVEIANRFEKVKCVQNPTKEFDDFNHWSILMNEARKIPAQRRVVISIDCDEFLSANTLDNLEWKTFTNEAEPGSLLVMNRIMIGKGFEEYAQEPDFLIGFIDDNKSNIGDLSVQKKIHNIRLPYPNYPVTLYRANVCKLMHYNVVDYLRFQSKMRWYQCYETILKDKSTFAIIQQYYNHLTIEKFWTPKDTFQIKPEFFQAYWEAGIDMTTIRGPHTHYYWDDKVIGYFQEHGTKLFARLPIWYHDWAAIAGGINQPISRERSFSDKLYSRLVSRIIECPTKFSSRIYKLVLKFI